MQDRQIWRMPKVSETIGARPATIFEWVRKGKFPQPVKVSPRFSGWYSDEVLDWVNTRPRA